MATWKKLVIASGSSAQYIKGDGTLGTYSTTDSSKLPLTGGTISGSLNIFASGGDANLRLRSGATRSGLFIDKPATTTVMGSALVLADSTFRLGTASYYHMEMTQAGNTILKGGGNTALTINTSQNATFTSNLTVNGGLYAAGAIYADENIYHNGDTDNKIRFETNKITLSNTVGTTVSTPTSGGISSLYVTAIHPGNTDVYKIGGMQAQIPTSAWLSANVKLLGPALTGYGTGIEYLKFDTDGTNKRAMFQGTLGIGVQPAVKFHIDTPDSTEALRISSDGSAWFKLYKGQAGLGGMLELKTESGASNVSLQSSSVFNSYINAQGGKLGIGTTGFTGSSRDLDAKLDVMGGINVEGYKKINFDGNGYSVHGFHKLNSITIDGSAVPMLYSFAYYGHRVQNQAGAIVDFGYKNTSTRTLFYGDLETNGDLIINAKQIRGGFGAETTSGTADWNHATNARSGNGYSLLLGSATNGPTGSQYYHTLGFEYGVKDGTGNLTQIGIPYTGAGIVFRSRYSGSWSAYKKVLDNETYSDYAVPKTGGTFTGNVGIGMTPTGALDIQATNNLKLRFYTGTTFKAGFESVTSAGNMIATSAVNDFAIRSQSNLLFASGGSTERMRLDTSGNLTVNSGSAIQFGDSSYKIIGSTAGNYLRFYTESTLALEINDSQKATLTGDLSVSGQTIMSSTLKLANTTTAPTNGESLPPALEFIGRGWDSNSGSDLIMGKIHLGGDYGEYGSGATQAWLGFSVQGSGGLGSEPETLIEGLRVLADGGVVANKKFNVGTHNSNSHRLVIESMHATVPYAPIVAGSADNNQAVGFQFVTRNSNGDENNKMYLTSTGLAIGTIPTHNLNVYNGSGASSMTVGKYASGKTVAVLGTSADTSGYFQIQSYASQGSTFGNIVLNAQGGNVGIGIANPAEKLHVNGGHLEVQNSGNTNVIINSASGSDGSVYFQEGGGMKARVFNDASANALVLTDGADNNTLFLYGQAVGIGTSTPTVGKLQVNHTTDAIIGITRTAGATSGNLGTVRFGNTNIDSSLVNITAYQDGATTAGGLKFQTQASGAQTADALTLGSDKLATFASNTVVNGGLYTNELITRTGQSLYIKTAGGTVITRFTDALSSIFTGDVYPSTNNTRTLGTSSYKWSNVHTTNLYASGASVLGPTLQLNNSGKLQFAGTDTYILGNAQYDYIQIAPNAATSYRFNQTGLGLGHSDPQELLHVKKSSGDVGVTIESVASGTSPKLRIKSPASRIGAIEFWEGGSLKSNIWHSTDDSLNFNVNSAGDNALSIASNKNATFAADLDASAGQSLTGWHTQDKIWVMPSDFMPSTGRNEYNIAMVDNGGEAKTMHGAVSGYVNIPIPSGYKVTHYRLNGTASVEIKAYYSDCTTATATTVMNAPRYTNTEYATTSDVEANDTTGRYMILRWKCTSTSHRLYGGYVKIAKI